MSELFNDLENSVVVESRVSGGIVLNWSRKGIGFGQLTLTARAGKLVADVEAMSDEFCLDIFKQALKERIED